MLQAKGNSESGASVWKGAEINQIHGEDPLEKEMATRFRFLAWEISWTEEPGRLQFMESQRIRHNVVTKQ